MATYPPPKKHNGQNNSVFNNDDYNSSNITSIGGGTSQTFNDSRYLQNSGEVVSSAQNTFNGILNVNSLATFQNVDIDGTLQSKKMTDALNVSKTFASNMTFSINDGMVYYISSNSTSQTTITFTDIPTTPQKSYIFTFVIKPTTVSSPWYIKPNSNFLNVNGISVTLSGLNNTTLPSSYAYIVQQITIFNISQTSTPNFIAITGFSGY
jgi:hypothetical protein